MTPRIDLAALHAEVAQESALGTEIITDLDTPTSRLRFRNVDADPSDPVETWPMEGIQTAVERGTLVDWERMLTAVQDDPWGDFTKRLQHVLTYTTATVTARMFEAAIAQTRATHKPA